MGTFIKRKSICLKSKILCKYDVIKILNLKVIGIKIINCLFSIDFASEFAKLLFKNGSKFIEFGLTIEENQSPKGNYIKKLVNSYKSFLIIFASLRTCKNLKILTLILNNQASKFSYSEIVLPAISFLNRMEVLKWSNNSYTSSNDKPIETFIKKNPIFNLRDLDLTNAYFISKTIPVLIKILINSPNLYSLNISNTTLNFCNDEDVAQKAKDSLFGKLNLKCLNISNSKNSLSVMFLLFAEFLVTNKSIINLIIKNSENVEFPEAKFLKTYIENTLILKEFTFTVNYIQNIETILKSIYNNKSIEHLDLSCQDFSNCPSLLTKLIKANKIIKRLILDKCNLTIGMDFIEALKANQYLEFLSLNENHVKENIVIHLKDTYLKSISLKQTNIKFSVENEINMALIRTYIDPSSTKKEFKNESKKINKK